MLTVQLHPYQEKDVDRILDRGSMLVAYSMGLGKTVMAIACIEEWIDRDEIDCALIVVPANLRYQWAQQIAKLTDVPTRVIRVKGDSGTWEHITVPEESSCVIVDGTKAQREKSLRTAIDLRPDYVLLTYESVVNDWSLVRKIKPGAIVLDEATAIKTFKAQRTRKIKRLQAPHRIALTGTPIENGKPEEIFSIMQWVDEDVLGRWDIFDKSYVVRNNFGGVLRYKNLPVLHARLSQAMVRKTQKDADVAPYLPEVMRSRILVTMDSKTRSAYKVIASDLLEELQNTKQAGSFDLFAYYHGQENGFDNSAQGRIMARLQALDMLLCHPDLIVASGMDYEESEAQRQAGVVKKNWPGSKYAYQIWQAGVVDDVFESPKLDALIDKVQEILADHPDNKIIVFSAWRNMLDIIEESLGMPDTVIQYHGGMNAGQKAAAQHRFMTDPACRVFLSSHAGAYGTDLYVANYLINYDLSWQAGRQDQINARHVRASSEWSHAHVIDLLVRDSTEVRRAELLDLKRSVGSAIVDNSGADERGRIEHDLMSLTEYLSLTTR